MKKVLYISDYYEIGGGESSLLNIMLGLKSNSLFLPVLLTPKDGKLTEIAKANDIKTFSFEYSKIERAWIKFIPIISIFGVIKLIKLINTEDIDIIHSNNSGFALTNAFLASFITRKKLIWTCHGWWENPFGLRGIIMNMFIDKVFTVSKFVRKHITLPRQKVCVTYLGINLDEVNRKSIGKFKSEIGVKKSEILIGMVGRYQDIKGQDLFVKAADSIFSKYKLENLKFVLIGDTLFSDKHNIYKNQVMELIERSEYKDNIIVSGFRDDMNVIYSDLDILVVPSVFESFSMVTLEGLAYGLRVVATNVGGPPEIIEDGKSGFIFKSKDVDDLVDKIIIALNADKIEFEKNAINRSACFSIDKIVQKIENEYMEVLKK